MATTQKYIESGVIEAYCLDQLDATERQHVERMADRYPEVHDEIVRTQVTLRHLATETPALRSRKNTIMHTLHQLRMEQEMSLHQLPLLTPYSDYQRWLPVVRHLQPTHHLDGVAFRVLQHTPNLEQTLVWMETALEEDGHDPDNFQESFLVLQGECECDFGGKLVRLSAGGYVSIPANTPHIIRNLQPGQPLFGLMQRYKAAA